MSFGQYLGIEYVLTMFIMLVYAASLKKSGLFDIFFQEVFKRTGPKTGFLIVLTIIYFFSPLFLIPVLIGSIQDISMRYKNKNIALSILLSALTFGSVILPFGNPRNFYYIIYYKSVNGTPLFFSEFLRIMFPIWIMMYFVILFTAIIVLKPELNGEISLRSKKFRYKEIIFVSFLLIFIIAYAMGKMNFLGFFFVTGFFIFTFVGKDTLKKVEWWMLIPISLSIPLGILIFTHPVKMTGIFTYLVTFFSSGIITSDVSTFIFPYPLAKPINFLYGISAGATFGILGSSLSIYLWKKGRVKPDMRTLFIISALAFLVGLIIIIIWR